MKKAVRLDFGRSPRSKKLVTSEIMERLPATGKLAILAVTISVLIGIPVGILSASKPNSLFDNAAMLAALSGVGMPAFWQGIMLILIFSVWLGWFPNSGRMGGLGVLHSACIYPGYAPPWQASPGCTRSTMLEVLQQDYIRTGHR